MQRSLRIRSSVVTLILVGGWILGGCVLNAAELHEEVIGKVEAAANRLIEEGALTGFSIALIDGDRTIYTKGFGLADKRRRLPATEATIYRAGSISKLFTAIATLQQVERGKIDLDAPVARYDPEFAIFNPFGGEVTLRQLMCHRSGLIRESPVGSYFDDSEPTVEATVASIASCVLVYPPNTKTKYSNIGVTVVGLTMAKVAGVPFAAYQQEEILRPIGMTSSSFLLEDPRLRKRLSKAYMLVADGKGGFNEIEAPEFELGTLPAGNLYTTAGDLARFVSFLFAGGRAGDRQLIRAETLEEMFTPQLTDQPTGFGLGFNVGSFAGLKTVNHNGAVYGFSASMTAIPEKQVGVVILANDDIAGGPVARLNEQALWALLETKGMTAPEPPADHVAASQELAACAGQFESPHLWADVEVEAGGLRVNLSGQQMVLTPAAPLEFRANGRFVHERPFTFQRGPDGAVSGFGALGQQFERVRAGAPAKIPEEWGKYLGSYGPSFIPLVVSVKHGHLYAMTENMLDYRLTPVNGYVFNMANGLYTDEAVVFQAGRSGRVHTAVLANMPLRRRR